jgi:hypothetical protein
LGTGFQLQCGGNRARASHRLPFGFVPQRQLAYQKAAPKFLSQKVQKLSEVG